MPHYSQSASIRLPYVIPRVFPLAALALAAMLVGCSDEPTVDLTAEELMLRVQNALATGGQIAQVRGQSEGVVSQTRQALWTVEASYDVPANSVRTSFEKAPGNNFDIQDRRIELQVGRDVYETYPGTDDPVFHYTRDERPACYSGEPDLLVMGLLCGLGPLESDSGAPKVAAVNFERRRAFAISFEDADGRISMLVVDRDTYLPLVHTLTFQGQGQTGIFRTTYSVRFVDRASLDPGFFDPRALGYRSPSEQWLAILDDPSLRGRVYWPGRSISSAGQYEAGLVGVEDRRTPAGKSSGPGHVLTISYQGAGGRFELDYWPAGAWEQFEPLLGDASIWAKCSESSAAESPVGRATLRRGFKPPAPYLPAPREAGQAPPPLPDVFPDGCPARDHDRFMAVIQTPDVTITINAPLALCCQDGRSLGVFDTEAGLQTVIARLRLRQTGE